MGEADIGRQFLNNAWILSYKRRSNFGNFPLAREDSSIYTALKSIC